MSFLLHLVRKCQESSGNVDHNVDLKVTSHCISKWGLIDADGSVLSELMIQTNAQDPKVKMSNMGLCTKWCQIDASIQHGILFFMFQSSYVTTALKPFEGTFEGKYIEECLTWVDWAVQEPLFLSSLISSSSLCSNPDQVIVRLREDPEKRQKKEDTANILFKILNAKMFGKSMEEPAVSIFRLQK